MKELMTWLAVGGAVIGMMALAWTGGGERMAIRAGHAGGFFEDDSDDDCCGRGPGIPQAWKLLVPPAACLSVSDEVEGLWRAYRETERKQHDAIWQLSLLHAERAGEAAIEAQDGQLRSLTVEYHARREALRDHVLYPDGMYGQMPQRVVYEQ